MSAAAAKERLLADYEQALTQQLNEAFNDISAEFLQMKLRDFLALSAVPRSSSASSAAALPQTPKTASRRTNRAASDLARASITATPLAAPPNAKSTPSARNRRALMTPRAFNPLLPETPANYAQNIAAKRPRLTIKAASATPAKSKAVDGSGGEEEIVQFQLQSGKVVDVDFSRSPQSALAEAQLMESADALQEVKAKIETYASHFMQYLKFFKKLQPASTQNKKK